MDLLTAVTLDTSSVELDGEQIELLYDLVRSLLCEERAKQSSGKVREEWVGRQREYDSRYSDAVNRKAGVSRPKFRLKIPNMVY